MSNDISTQYTKEQNRKCGRYGYYKGEKITNISPAEYGMFISKKRRKKS